MSNSAEETARLAAGIGRRLQVGDTLLLEGPVGAGKTHFARHLVQSLLDVPEDVPSPTFTLVQVYETSGPEIWHADLYRLTSCGEIEELGLSDAFETAICLIEWPERLADLRPKNALELSFQPDPDYENRRRIGFAWSDPRWAWIQEQLANV